MTIETKYQPRSLVWMMSENKAIQVEVHDMEVRIYRAPVGPVLYGVYLRVMANNNLLAGVHNENFLYTDKQSLLESL